MSRGFKFHVRKPGKPRKWSPDVRRQRELAWVKCILDAAAANLEHALAVNAYTMRSADLALVRRTKREVEKCARAVHEEMQP